MSNEMPFAVSQGLLGRGHRLDFHCPRCRVPLHAPLADAGKPDNCPECRASFTTPGRSTLREHREAEARAAQREADARQADAEARAEAAKQRAEQELERRLAASMVAAREDSSPARSGGWIGALGWLLVISGAVAFTVGLGMDSSIPTSDGTGRIHNLGLLNAKLLATICGLLGSLFGAVCVGIDHVLGELHGIRAAMGRAVER